MSARSGWPAIYDSNTPAAACDDASRFASLQLGSREKAALDARVLMEELAGLLARDGEDDAAAQDE